MLENSYGLTFFLKTPRKLKDVRMVYARVTVDGVPKEKSTNEQWDINRWDQKLGRAIGHKEDAKVLNNFLDSLETKIINRKTELLNLGKAITAEKLIMVINGRIEKRNKLLEEFKEHNDEIKALSDVGELSKATYEKYEKAKGHISDFLMFQYEVEDMEFVDLDFAFINKYDLYLRTEKKCNNNTTLKYISNFKKVVLRAIDKEIIKMDPFRRFKRKRTKANKRPISSEQLRTLENKKFSTERLEVVRDIFVFQCYTGLAYIDVFQLQKNDIQVGIDGEWWIISNRQKTTAETKIPLLPKAIDLIKKYENHPTCLKRNSVLPVRSNQKCNEYLKEIADLCNFNFKLETHKARRTFASTVTLKNGVPMNIVKEMLGHASISQTEEYAITEEVSIGLEMQNLKQKLMEQESGKEDNLQIIARLKKELAAIENNICQKENGFDIDISVLNDLELQIISLKDRLLSKTA